MTPVVTVSTFSGFNDGRLLWLDVGTVSTARTADGTKAAHVPGVAALSVKVAKRKHYDPLAAGRVPPATFIPLALELDGRFGDVANDFFKRLSLRVGESFVRTPDSRTGAVASRW